MSCFLLFLLNALITHEMPGGHDQDVAYLGFLERGGRSAEEAEMDGGTAFPRVRVVFEKTGSNWEIVHSQPRDSVSLRESAHWYPSPIRWTVVSDGKALGEVVTRRPDEVRSYGAIGLQVIASSTLPASVLPLPPSHHGSP